MNGKTYWHISPHTMGICRVDWSCRWTGCRLSWHNRRNCSCLLRHPHFQMPRHKLHPFLPSPPWLLSPTPLMPVSSVHQQSSHRPVGPKRLNKYLCTDNWKKVMPLLLHPPLDHPNTGYLRFIHLVTTKNSYKRDAYLFSPPILSFPAVNFSGRNETLCYSEQKRTENELNKPDVRGHPDTALSIVCCHSDFSGALSKHGFHRHYDHHHDWFGPDKSDSGTKIKIEMLFFMSRVQLIFCTTRSGSMNEWMNANMTGWCSESFKTRSKRLEEAEMGRVDDEEWENRTE